MLTDCWAQREAMFAASQGLSLGDLLDTFGRLRNANLDHLVALGLTDADLARPLREGAVDRGVHLAALLTAAIRPTLPTAPGIGYDAPVQASGKTLLAKCAGALATGALPGLTLNFSSTSAVMSAGIVMGVVLLSTIYPSRKAAQIAAPAMNEEVFETDPDGDEWTLPLPFSISAAEAAPMRIGGRGFRRRRSVVGRRRRQFVRRALRLRSKRLVKFVDGHVAVTC